MITAMPQTGLGCVPIPVVGCVVSVVGGAVGGGIGSDIGSAAGSVANGILDVFVGYLAKASTWLVAHIAGLIGVQTDPDLSALWFLQKARYAGVVLEATVVPLLLVATIGAVLRQDLKRLARIWAVGLPVAIVTGLAGVLLANYAMSVTDALTALVAGGHGLRVAPALTHLTLEGIGSGAPVLVTAALYSIAILGAVVVWLELLLRQSAIYIVLFFMPLALATYVWPASAAVAKRAVQILVALILSKFVILATISLGLAALSGPARIDQQFAGVGILLLASFAPFALMKLAPIVEVAAIAHLEGMSRRPFQAAGRVASTAAAPGSAVRTLLATRSSQKSSTKGATPVTPQPLATRKADYPISQGRPISQGGSISRGGPVSPGSSGSG